MSIDLPMNGSNVYEFKTATNKPKNTVNQISNMINDVVSMTDIKLLKSDIIAAIIS
jgi:hypothetical protein